MSLSWGGSNSWDCAPAPAILRPASQMWLRARLFLKQSGCGQLSWKVVEFHGTLILRDGSFEMRLIENTVDYLGVYYQPLMWRLLSISKSSPTLFWFPPWTHHVARPRSNPTVVGKSWARLVLPKYKENMAISSGSLTNGMGVEEEFHLGVRLIRHPDWLLSD